MVLILPLPRHLAYADLLIVICFGIPIFITHVSDKWILGRLTCTVCAYLFSVFPTATLSFTAIVGLNRLLRCTYPQKLNGFRRHHAMMLAYSTWLFSCVPGVSKLFYQLKAVFLPAWAVCYFDLIRSDYPKVLRVIAGSFITIPSLILIVANVLLIIVSTLAQREACKRRRERIGRFRVLGKEENQFNGVEEISQTNNKSKQNHRNESKMKNFLLANKTVYLISLLYFIAWIPFSISVTSQRRPDFHLPLWAHNLLNHFYLLRNVGNPIIYVVVNRKFYQFTVRLLRRIWYHRHSNAVVQVNKCVKRTTVFENTSMPRTGSTRKVSAVSQNPSCNNKVTSGEIHDIRESELGPGGVYIG